MWKPAKASRICGWSLMLSVALPCSLRITSAIATYSLNGKSTP